MSLVSGEGFLLKWGAAPSYLRRAQRVVRLGAATLPPGLSAGGGNGAECIRLSHPEVAWKEIAGFRDIAAHKYQTLRMEDVYETAVTDFPDLQQKITRILAE